MAIYIIKSWYKKGVELVPWSTGSEQQIAAILEAFYDNKLSADEITALKNTYFPIGAKRKIGTSAMTDKYVSENHRSWNLDYVIIGHEHDELYSPVNGHTKALLTIQRDKIFYKNTDLTYSSDSPSRADEGGFMHSNTSYVGWGGCDRRNWCNDTFCNALQLRYINLVKVKKPAYNVSSYKLDTFVDTAFLLSEQEVFGKKTRASIIEGTQYAYYAADISRACKKPSYTNSSSAQWWLRSVASSSSNYFCGIAYSGTATSGYSQKLTKGICPAFCL